MPIDTRPAFRERVLLWTASALFLLAVFTLLARPRPPATGGQTPARTVDVTILQLNDVYEMFPVDGRGGLARISTLRQRLESKNPNTIAVLAGDLLSPSALGEARVGGSRLAGRQMIDLMNRIGLKFAVFGNHEFDLKEAELTARIAQSTFSWLGSNVDKVSSAEPFGGSVRDVVVPFHAPDGTEVRVGLFGLTIASTPTKPYVTYRPNVATAQSEVASLKSRADVIIAVTHLSLAEDEEVATMVPGIDVVIGGHEHQNIYARRGAGLTPIAKADSNGRTVYVHHLRWDATARHVDVESRLTPITNALPDDATAAKAAEDWRVQAFNAFEADGFKPNEVVTTLTAELDGTEASVRTKCTSLTQLIGQGMVSAAKGAFGAVYNSGSIRLDDILRPGPLTQYDVMRVLPYPGKVVLVRIGGQVLKDALEKGQTLRNSGGYLQTFGIDARNLKPTSSYLIAMNDFLAGGNEKGLEILGQDAARTIVDKDVKEWRQATIAQFIASPGGVPCPAP